MNAEHAEAAVDIGMIEAYVRDLIPSVVSFVLEAVLALLIFWISVKVIKWVCKIFDKFLEARNVDPSAIRFLVSLVRVSLYMLIGVTLAVQLG